MARAPSATWSYAEIGRAFALYDANRSGKLDYRELRAALRGMGATAEDSEVAQILRSYDEARAPAPRPNPTPPHAWPHG